MAEAAKTRTDTEARPDAKTLQALRDVANRLRIHVIQAIYMKGPSHPPSCYSAAEVMSVLFCHTMRYKNWDPQNVHNDRFIVSKRLSFVEVLPGSLGQELGTACGMAYTGRYFDKASYRVFCLMGGDDISEGSVWEALAFASHYNLDNLVAIFDMNCWGKSCTMPPKCNPEAFRMSCKAFGWNTFVVDGHDVEALCQVFWQAAQVKNKPTAIVAKTFKGRRIPHIEDTENWQGRPVPRERADAIIKLIQSQILTTTELTPKPPVEDSPPVNITNIEMTFPTIYRVGDKVATRKAYGVALAKLGYANERVVVVDTDTKNATFSELFKKEHPERFIECFIAEQNMVSVALGCASRGRTIAFVTSFAAFLIRAFDQIRMCAASEANINFVGSHCGVSTGEDGPALMALEDLAIFRTIPNCTVFYPSDAVSTEHAVYLAANTKGICFIRTSRPETPVIYTQNESFAVGQAKVVRHSINDRVTVIGAGVTLHEALAAADDLAKQGISVRVIDLFTIKPLDAATIISNAKATGGCILVVEDHHQEGGIGEAVCAAVSMEPGILVQQLAVAGVPRSGKPSRLLEMFGISARHIVATVKCLLVHETCRFL